MVRVTLRNLAMAISAARVVCVMCCLVFRLRLDSGWSQFLVGRRTAGIALKTRALL